MKNIKQKNLGAIFIFSLALLASFFVINNPNSVHAGDGCSEDIMIENGVFSYDSSKIDGSAIDFENNVLTLNNLKGDDVSLCFYNEDRDTNIDIVLEGENELSYINAYNDITVKGNGTLDLEELSFTEHLNIEKGTINLDDIKGDWVTINDGILNISGDSDRTDLEIGAINLIGGKISSKTPIITQFFYQKGGTFEVKIDEEVDFCVAAFYLVVDGGTMNIECNNAVAMMMYYSVEMDGEYSRWPGTEDGMIRWVENEYGKFAFPIHGAAAFIDGDVTLKSGVASLIVYIGGDNDSHAADAALEEKGKDYFVATSEGLTIEPSVLTVDAKAVSKTESYVSFTDGTEGFDISGNPDDGFTASDNVVKTLRIYKKSEDNNPDVPKTDGNSSEDNKKVKAGNQGFFTVAPSSAQSDLIITTILTMILSLLIISFIKKAKGEQEN